jgi:preprotein translocase subunit SecB
MRAAQISLTNYFVSELQFSANAAFNPGALTAVEIEDLQVVHDIASKTEDRRSWQVKLRVGLNAPAERNMPCTFLVEIIGFVHVAESVSEDHIERLATINGLALVFSAAREVVRAVTARGPFKSVLLPTVTFWEPLPRAEAHSAIEPQSAAAETASR